MRKRDYLLRCEEAAQLLAQHGVDLRKQATYDFKPTKERFSVFHGRVTAIWHQSHFKAIPFGHFKVVE
jgi:hypothetical protein